MSGVQLIRVSVELDERAPPGMLKPIISEAYSAGYGTGIRPLPAKKKCLLVLLSMSHLNCKFDLF